LRNEARRSPEAIPLLEKAVELAPPSEAAHYALMIAYRNAGRMDDARREKTRLDELHKTPDGEFSDFLKKLGEKPPAK
jgi:Flp pilus assembly protein TadD